MTGADAARVWSENGRLDMSLNPVPKAWLYAPGSLTKQLRRACAGELRVDVQAQGWVRAEAREARALGVRLGVRLWRREVILRCEHAPYVHAVSFSTPAGARALGLRRLGLRPLGNVLFARGAACVQRGVVRRFACPMSGRHWRRWALFVVRAHPVVLYEDFLPALPPRRG